MQGVVVSINISKNKGTTKQSIKEAMVIENYGIEGDAHASSHWHRQISLLALESIQKMMDKGLTLNYGDFAENITTKGIELLSLPVGTKLQIGEVILEITQHGKSCHSKCEIFKIVGNCIMPKEGIFAKVLKGGKIKVGDEIKVL
ncbi:mOSC domain-containing protein YiiM [Thermodesulfovibrio aggregans]|uniref:MOSC domain-containing protein YiiM n=1 Tax=Thermodesulfovibrio aggregans TaxID=86166 RepID=A0A0U9HU92_9BACT|nr:MOSC domain-containing protein [Thermodesulfovibrio aggregans]GAQ94157.1 mOSC domain-containing protein YiiM [Thermodesulfovibrio aggregans]